MLFSFLFRFEDVKNHHDQEDGNGDAEQNAQQHLSDEPDTERLEEKQREMMDEHQTQHITEEPKPAQLAKIRLGDVFKFLVARNEADDRRSAKSHQSGGSSMKSWCARKQVDSQTQGKAQNQQLPFGCAERQQHNENQIDIGMHIPSEADMVDNQHLKEHEHDETDDL